MSFHALNFNIIAQTDSIGGPPPGYAKNCGMSWCIFIKDYEPPCKFLPHNVCTVKIQLSAALQTSTFTLIRIAQAPRMAWAIGPFIMSFRQVCGAVYACYIFSAVLLLDASTHQIYYGGQFQLAKRQPLSLNSTILNVVCSTSACDSPARCR